MQVMKQQLEPDMEEQTDSKLGKAYVKAVYCLPAYVTYRQSTSCEMPGWVKSQAGIRLPGEISPPSDGCRLYHSKGRKQIGTKEPL